MSEGPCKKKKKKLQKLPLFLCLIFLKKHPLFEEYDGKRERLKQSASKLACQKTLNQYPGSLPTQPRSPLTPLALYSSIPFPIPPAVSTLLHPFTAALLHSRLYRAMAGCVGSERRGYCIQGRGQLSSRHSSSFERERGPLPPSLCWK